MASDVSRLALKWAACMGAGVLCAVVSLGMVVYHALFATHDLRIVVGAMLLSLIGVCLTYIAKDYSERIRGSK